MDFDFTKLCNVFRIPATDYAVERVQHGHINSTFLVTSGGIPKYILQKVNTEVFSNIDLLMANYRLVSETLGSYRWPAGFHLTIPELILTKEGKTHYSGITDRCWRLITFIDGADCSAVPRNTETAYQGGLAFGTFLTGLSEIDPNSLHQILPDFHSLKKRYHDFLNILESDPAGRKSLADDEIGFVMSRKPYMMKIPDCLESGKIPLRVVHNDTKLSNVIFSGDGTYKGVIDLDTVMAGSALFDFGDAIRSCANAACEDEPDLTRVKFDIGLFDAFSKGYIESTGSLLLKKETDLLPESALLMTYIIGLRFLTDYLDGDKYFHTDYESHNMVRARVQFRLLRQMELCLNEMHTIIENHRR
jgi:Ser/Thr protein kinase RdoA (MazF antagonist)